MGLRPTKGHEDALWQIRLAGESACPTRPTWGGRFRLPTDVFNGVGAGFGNHLARVA